MDIEAWRRQVEDRLLAVVAGTDQIDDPHIVVVTDTSSATSVYFGPYPDATAALHDAEALRRELCHYEGGSSVTSTVARLYLPESGPAGAGAPGEATSSGAGCAVPSRP